MLTHPFKPGQRGCRTLKASSRYWPASFPPPLCRGQELIQGDGESEYEAAASRLRPQNRLLYSHQHRKPHGVRELNVRSHARFRSHLIVGNLPLTQDAKCASYADSDHQL